MGFVVKGLFGSMTDIQEGKYECIRSWKTFGGKKVATLERFSATLQAWDPTQKVFFNKELFVYSKSRLSSPQELFNQPACQVSRFLAFNNFVRSMCLAQKVTSPKLKNWKGKDRAMPRNLACCVAHPRLLASKPVNQPKALKKPYRIVRRTKQLEAKPIS